jgi:hypothetical protein
MRVSVGLLIRMKMELNYRPGSTVIKSIGWNCDDIATRPARIRHILAALWMEQFMEDVRDEKYAPTYTPKDITAEDSLIPMLKRVTAEELVVSITSTIGLTGPENDDTPNTKVSDMSNIRWRRHMAQVVNLRQSEDWQCEHDTDA